MNTPTFTIIFLTLTLCILWGAVNRNGWHRKVTLIVSAIVCTIQILFIVLFHRLALVMGEEAFKNGHCPPEYAQVIERLSVTISCLGTLMLLTIIALYQLSLKKYTK